MTTLNLDPWWDEPAYRSATATFSERGTFILRKLSEHDPIRFKTVMDDLYRDEPPDPVDITKFQWHTILAYRRGQGRAAPHGAGVAVKGLRRGRAGPTRRLRRLPKPPRLG